MHTSALPIAAQIIGIILLVLAIALPALLCSFIGARKGYSSLLFLLLGLVSSVIGLIVAAILPSRHAQVLVGGIAEVQQRVELADGRHLPRGLRARVHDLRVDEGEVVCLIEDPLGERHWVSRSVLVPS